MQNILRHPFPGGWPMLLKTFESWHGVWELHPARWGGLLALILACAIGCGPAEEQPEEKVSDEKAPA